MPVWRGVLTPSDPLDARDPQICPPTPHNLGLSRDWDDAATYFVVQKSFSTDSDILKAASKPHVPRGEEMPGSGGGGDGGDGDFDGHSHLSDYLIASVSKRLERGSQPNKMGGSPNWKTHLPLAQDPPSHPLRTGLMLN